MLEKSSTCIGKKNYADAKTHCENRGMRLCSGMEIREGYMVQDKCGGTEGKPDNHGTWKTKFFWTRKPCKEEPKWNGKPGSHKNRDIHFQVVSHPYDAQNSGNYGTDHDLCISQKSNAEHHTACCADNGARYCHECPENSCKWSGDEDKKGGKINYG